MLRERENFCNCSLGVFCNWRDKASFPRIPSVMVAEKFGDFDCPNYQQ